MNTVWKAPQHTIAKIELLKAYLHAWFSILGVRGWNQNIYFVDGFCGPGEYTNHTIGSPIAAIDAADSVLSTHASKWNAGNVHFTFIDKDIKTIKYLESKLSGRRFHSRISFECYAKTFVDGIKLLRSSKQEAFGGRNSLFVFIDPFGAKGAPFGIVREILESPCSEVLINLNAVGIARIFCAGGDANNEVLTEIFGDDTWIDAIAAQRDFDGRCRAVLDLYKDKLRSLPGVHYVYSFEMRGRRDSLNYFLVFASRHQLGLVKMKEAMKTVDLAGNYCFSDAHAHQRPLFRGDNVDEYALEMFQAFKGRTVSLDELRDFSLNETPFLNPTKMLNILEKEGRIQVEEIEIPGKKKRRKGTFNDKSVRAVRFDEGGLYD